MSNAEDATATSTMASAASKQVREIRSSVYRPSRRGPGCSGTRVDSVDRSAKRGVWRATKRLALAGRPGCARCCSRPVDPRWGRLVRATTTTTTTCGGEALPCVRDTCGVPDTLECLIKPVTSVCSWWRRGKRVCRTDECLAFVRIEVSLQSGCGRGFLNAAFRLVARLSPPPPGARKTRVWQKQTFRVSRA